MSLAHDGLPFTLSTAIAVQLVQFISDADLHQRRFPPGVRHSYGAARNMMIRLAVTGIPHGKPAT
jgi:hypothetical protein